MKVCWSTVAAIVYPIIFDTVSVTGWYLAIFLPCKMDIMERSGIMHYMQANPAINR